MDPGAQLIIKLITMSVFGTICALIARSKGRNPTGWFFVGFFTTCIGLIVTIAMSDLKAEKARFKHLKREHRRLREQLKQERLKNQVFQTHVRKRIDKHDDVLGINTRISDDQLKLESTAEDEPTLQEGSFGDEEPLPEENIADAGPGQEHSFEYEEPLSGETGDDDNFSGPTTSIRKTRWYVMLNNRIEEMSFLRLSSLYQLGNITDLTLLRAGGEEEMKPLGSIPGLWEELHKT